MGEIVTNTSRKFTIIEDDWGDRLTVECQGGRISAITTRNQYVVIDPRQARILATRLVEWANTVNEEQAGG